MKIPKPNEAFSSEISDDNVYFLSALEVVNTMVGNKQFHYISSDDVKILHIGYGMYNWSRDIIEKIAEHYRRVGWNVSLERGHCAHGPFEAIKLSMKPGFIRGNQLYKDEADYKEQQAKWQREIEERKGMKIKQVKKVPFLDGIRQLLGLPY